MRTVALAFATACTACSPFGGGAFECTESVQCGAGGTCEPNGLCAFPDATCVSGWRYGAASGDLAGVCVGDEPPDAAVADAAADGPPVIDGGPDAPPPEPFCDPADATQRLCLAFEGDAVDGSGSANPVTTSAITFAAGQVGQAVAVDAASRLDIAETTSLDIDHMTLEAWVNTVPPGAGRAGILDNNGQYGFFILPNGDLKCTPSGGLTVPGAIVADTWTHVACTYDGTTQIVYVNGVQAAMLAAAGTLPTAGVNGLSIAGDNPAGPDRLTGQIDQLRIYSEARTAGQICRAAGLSSCP